MGQPGVSEQDVSSLVQCTNQKKKLKIGRGSTENRSNATNSNAGSNPNIISTSREKCDQAVSQAVETVIQCILLKEQTCMLKIQRYRDTHLLELV